MCSVCARGKDDRRTAAKGEKNHRPETAQQKRQLSLPKAKCHPFSPLTPVLHPLTHKGTANRASITYTHLQAGIASPSHALSPIPTRENRSGIRLRQSVLNRASPFVFAPRRQRAAIHLLAHNPSAIPFLQLFSQGERTKIQSPHLVRAASKDRRNRRGHQ